MQTFAHRPKIPQTATVAKPSHQPPSNQFETHSLPHGFSFSQISVHPPGTQDSALAHFYNDSPKSKSTPKKTTKPTKTTPAKRGNVTAVITKGPLSRPPTGSVDPGDFGTTHFDPTFTGVSSPFTSGKCTITATFNPISPWGTQSLGKHDVPSATARIITADNYPDIVTDLTPASDSPFQIVPGSNVQTGREDSIRIDQCSREILTAAVHPNKRHQRIGHRPRESSGDCAARAYYKSDNFRHL